MHHLFRPAEDGYSVDETYPSGPMRPPLGMQRGSVLDMMIYPGDPLTPGIGATKDAKRLKISDASTIVKIPVLPISYVDARASRGARRSKASRCVALPEGIHEMRGPYDGCDRHFPISGQSFRLRNLPG